MKWEEILKKLKVTYKDKGLSDKILEVFAKRIAGTAEDDKIDEAIQSLEGELTLQQMLHDQIRTLKSENDKLKNQISKGADDQDSEPDNPPKGKEEQEEAPTDPSNEPPAWAKALMESVSELKQSKARLETKEQLEAKFKELGVSDKFYKRHIQNRTFKTSDEMEAFVTEVKQDFDELKSDLVKVPSGGGVNPSFDADPDDGAGVSSLMKNYSKRNDNAKNN